MMFDIHTVPISCVFFVFFFKSETYHTFFINNYGQALKLLIFSRHTVIDMPYTVGQKSKQFVWNL